MYEHMIEVLMAAQNDTSEHFPIELIERVASGESAIKVFREYRKLSQIAKILAVDLEDIV